jgi:hypothetical protein
MNMIEPTGDQFLNFLARHESFSLLITNRIEEGLSVKKKINAFFLSYSSI